MTVVLVTLIVATVVTDYFGEPPTYLTGLLGTAAGVWFAALGSDKQKRDIEVSDTAHRADDTANRAEAKIDAVSEVAVENHPDDRDKLPPPVGGREVP